MAKFCIVAPTQILTELQSRGQLGDHHLLLAHDVVQHPKVYVSLFAMRQRKTDSLVILDNSAYELKSSVDVNMVFEAACLSQPDCIVLPDHYLDGISTTRDTLKAVHEWDLRVRQLHWDCELMCIPQGKDFHEWIWCAEQLSQDNRIGWWGVPRNLQEVHSIPRRDAIEVLHALNPHRKIHLFGFSDNYWDDLLSAQHPLADSIDSTTPLRAGSLGMKMSLGIDLPSRGDWWESARWDEQIYHNLRWTQEVFKFK